MFFKNYKLIGYTSEDYSFNKLNQFEVEIPTGNHPGAFGYKRKYHTHEGIDLYCQENDEVISLTDGKIVDIGWFTGEKVDSPWWNCTQYIAVEYNDFVILYGELKVNPNLLVGNIITKDQILGNIVPVLKSPKNGRPANMLHLELYDKNLYTEPKEWINEIPKGLMNPLILFDFLNIEAK